MDPPAFAAQHSAGLRDFWSVYDAHYDAIQQITLRLAEDHPDFGPLLRAMSPEQSAAQNARSRELLRAAVVDGAWAPYAEDLRTQGSLYAHLGVSFAGWYDVVGAFKRAMVPAIVETFVREPARTSAALTAMLAFIDHAMSTIAQQYVETRAETDIRRHALFLDSIIENLPNMVFVKEAKELRFERLNRAGETLLGMPRSAFIGKNDFDFFPREQAEAFQARDRETLEGKQVVDIPEEPIQTGGGERWLHTKKVPIVDEHGTPVFLLGISEDITQARRNAAELKRAKEAADVANRELESFSYTVAHDLRAPLRGINGFSRALIEDCAGALDATGRGYLERICAAADRMGHLIDALLALSRVARTTVLRASVDLGRMASEIAAQLHAANPQREIEFACEPGLVVQGDERLLRALLENLLANAWKFTRTRPVAHVRVGSEVVSGEKAYFVEDDGAGFDMAHADKLFAPFGRLHSPDAFEGSGIGLATVQRIVARHGGRIWGEGAVDRGARFLFTLSPAEDGRT